MQNFNSIIPIRFRKTAPADCPTYGVVPMVNDSNIVEYKNNNKLLSKVQILMIINGTMSTFEKKKLPKNWNWSSD